MIDSEHYGEKMKKIKKHSPFWKNNLALLLRCHSKIGYEIYTVIKLHVVDFFVLGQVNEADFRFVNSSHKWFQHKLPQRPRKTTIVTVQF